MGHGKGRDILFNEAKPCNCFYCAYGRSVLKKLEEENPAWLSAPLTEEELRNPYRVQERQDSV